MFLKICGITRHSDALDAVKYGATALGFVFWRSSPRYVAPDMVRQIVAELPASVETVGVFVNEPVEGIRRVMSETRLTTVQLHGDEPAFYAEALSWPVLRSVTIATASVTVAAWPEDTMFVLDAADPQRRGGTGQTVDWTNAATLARDRRVVLAGGLTPANVGGAVVLVRPYGVDVSSGVEDAPGVKNGKKVAQFLTVARKAMESSHLLTEK